MFVAHYYLQHAETGWKGSFGLRYQASFILSHVSMKGDISFAYRKSYPVSPAQFYSTENDNDEDEDKEKEEDDDMIL